MSAAERVAQAAVGTVSIGQQSKLQFRFRQIDSRMVIEVGGAFLLASRLPADAPEKADAKSWTKALSYMTVVAVAGTTAISVDAGETWEECQIVGEKNLENLPDNKIHETSLPPGTIKELAIAILKHSTDGGAAASRLASFL